MYRLRFPTNTNVKLITVILGYNTLVNLFVITLPKFQYVITVVVITDHTGSLHIGTNSYALQLHIGFSIKLDFKLFTPRFKEKSIIVPKKGTDA
jgi:hypothetical protein